MRVRLRSGRRGFAAPRLSRPRGRVCRAGGSCCRLYGRRRAVYSRLGHAGSLLRDSITIVMLSLITKNAMSPLTYAKVSLAVFVGSTVGSVIWSTGFERLVAVLFCQPAFVATSAR